VSEVNSARYSEWRVWKRLDYRAQAICKIHGQTPNDLVEVALEEYIQRIVKDWFNVETYAVVTEIRSNPEWAAVAYEADDYVEFCRLMTDRGITHTRSGVYIKERKIARMRVNIEIRKRNRFHDEKED
jgi:hypothetical protein